MFLIEFEKIFLIIIVQKFLCLIKIVQNIVYFLIKLSQRLMRNQGLVNLDFDDNKTRFRTNDHILSVIRQDDF